MPAGRPPLGPGLVDRVEGPEGAKERARIALETLTGRLTLEEACERLGISRARFCEQREQALEAFVSAFVPGAPGRPRTAVAEGSDAALARDLERRVKDLEFDLECARRRTEIALAMPHLLKVKAASDTDAAAGGKRRSVPSARDGLRKRTRPR